MYEGSSNLMVFSYVLVLGGVDSLFGSKILNILFVGTGTHLSMIFLYKQVNFVW